MGVGACMPDRSRVAVDGQIHQPVLVGGVAQRQPPRLPIDAVHVRPVRASRHVPVALAIQAIELDPEVPSTKGIPALMPTFSRSKSP